MLIDFSLCTYCKSKVPIAGEIFNKSIDLKSRHQDDFIQCHYDSFGQRPKGRGEEGGVCGLT